MVKGLQTAKCAGRQLLHLPTPSSPSAALFYPLQLKILLLAATILFTLSPIWPKKSVKILSHFHLFRPLSLHRFGDVKFNFPAVILQEWSKLDLPFVVPSAPFGLLLLPHHRHGWSAVSSSSRESAPSTPSAGRFSFLIIDESVVINHNG